MKPQNRSQFPFLKAAVSVALLVPAQALAQTIPSTAEPGVITRGIGDEPLGRPQSDTGLVLGAEEAAGQNLSAEKVFTLNGVVLDGSTVYAQPDVDGFAKGYVGEKVSFADLNAISQAMTRDYREKGYVFSRVILPPQKIDGGVVHYQAIEGRVTDVQIEGDFKDQTHLIQRIADQIKSDGPSNTADIERYLLLIDDLPGITARSLMRPSDVPGGGTLIITIVQDRVEGSVGIDNRGSTYLGRGRATAVAAFNSLFGIHDRTTLRGIVTENTNELRFGDITHEEQVGTEGMRVKARYAITATEPGNELKALDVNGRTHLFDLQALYPVIRSRQYNFNLIGGFTAINSTSDILGSQVAEDRLRYAHAGGRFDFTDALSGVNQFEISMAKGLDIFNPTEDAATGRSRSNGEHDFVRYNLEAERLQDLPGDFSFHVAFSGQYSPDVLLASEEFAVGGDAYGRAYDSGEITGDSGAAASFELRYGGHVDNRFLNAYELYSFYDLGTVWNHNPSVSENANDSLASVGLGVRFNAIYETSGYLELGKPLTHEVGADGNKDARVFFSLSKRF